MTDNTTAPDDNQPQLTVDEVSTLNNLIRMCSSDAVRAALRAELAKDTVSGDGASTRELLTLAMQGVGKQRRGLLTAEELINATPSLITLYDWSRPLYFSSLIPGLQGHEASNLFEKLMGLFLNSQPTIPSELTGLEHDSTKFSGDRS